MATESPHGPELDQIVTLLNACFKLSNDETRAQLRQIIAGYADARSGEVLNRLEQAVVLGEKAVANAKEISAMLDAALERERKLLLELAK